MKRLSFTPYLIIAFSCFILLSCVGNGGNKSSSMMHDGDTLHLRYAKLLAMTSFQDYTLVTIRNPWDTLKILHTYILVAAEDTLPDDLPQGTVIRTPLKRSVVYSSVHCSLLDMLGCVESIGGVCDLKYIRMPFLQQACASGRVVDCGDSMNPDIEKLIEMHPDAVLLSPFENSGGYGRIERLGIPLVECADYMETSPLGRAEWMRFYGLLFGVSQQADSLFSVVETRYQQMQDRVKKLPRELSIMSDLKIGSTWYAAGGCSTMGRLYDDAGANYAFSDDRHTGSVPLAFETVYDLFGQADIWLIKYNSEYDYTYTSLQADYAGYAAFKAFQTRNIYGCNTHKSSFYEEVPFRPDYLLADLIQLLHPDIKDLGGLRYFSKLSE